MWIQESSLRIRIRSMIKLGSGSPLRLLRIWNTVYTYRYAAATGWESTWTACLGWRERRGGTAVTACCARFSAASAPCPGDLSRSSGLPGPWVRLTLIRLPYPITVVDPELFRLDLYHCCGSGSVSNWILILSALLDLDQYIIPLVPSQHFYAAYLCRLSGAVWLNQFVSNFWGKFE